jgi:hypothetical protein
MVQEGAPVTAVSDEEASMTLAEIKRRIQAGQAYYVTNHYITRTDHPCYGTRWACVLKTTSTGVYLSAPEGRAESQWPAFKWPKASQVQADDDGTIRLYGGGCNQAPDELFLTLTPDTCEECREPMSNVPHAGHPETCSRHR